jgi:acetyl-CoA carboxylase carboxyl transferase subunit alpha
MLATAPVRRLGSDPVSDPSRTRADSTPPGMAFERPIRELEDQLAELEELSKRTNLDISEEVASLRQRLAKEIASAYAELTPWERVNVARHQERPTASDYIEKAFDESFELHGDKAFGEDRAIVTALCRIGERRFLVVGNRKGRSTKERMAYNFGCAHPEGYRKALRKMQLAEKLGLPIVSLINTPGAYPGIGAEERGQATAIAENILGMFSLRTPILVIVIGEGGSGGALGIGVGDRVLMLEYSYYSVISPEGCAAILWKDAERTPDAATALRLTAPDLLELKLIDGVVPEPAGGAHRNPQGALTELRATILRELEALEQIPLDELLARRRRKFRRSGEIPGRFPVLD